jgi:hypothetical protein
MKNKYQTVGTVPKSNRKTVEKGTLKIHKQRTGEERGEIIFFYCF